MHVGNLIRKSRYATIPHNWGDECEYNGTMGGQITTNIQNIRFCYVIVNVLFYVRLFLTMFIRPGFVMNVMYGIYTFWWEVPDDCRTDWSKHVAATQQR